jgi:hypothetical protein
MRWAHDATLLLPCTPFVLVGDDPHVTRDRVRSPVSTSVERPIWRVEQPAAMERSPAGVFVRSWGTQAAMASSWARARVWVWPWPMRWFRRRLPTSPVGAPLTSPPTPHTAQGTDIPNKSPTRFFAESNYGAPGRMSRVSICTRLLACPVPTR